MEKKQVIAIGIALQTQVLKTCPIHRQLYFDDDVNPAGAFALAIELVRKRKPYVQEFDNDVHALTDLLSHTLATAPVCCPECQVGYQPPLQLSFVGNRGGFGEGALQGR
ncbi:MAG TPA: hypothetical protein VGD54_17630 [Steroidobacteraceae bacterium]